MFGSSAFRTVACAADEDAVGRLVAATERFNDEEIEVARELVRARLTLGAASGYEFVLVDRPATLDHPLGLDAYACYGRAPGTRSSYHLFWIAVDPVLQGRGVGSRLLARVEREIGAGTTVWVETSGRADYGATRRFYERHGYEIAARLDDFFAPGDDKLVLVKRLGEPAGRTAGATAGSGAASVESLGRQPAEEAHRVLSQGADPVAALLDDHRGQA